MTEATSPIATAPSPAFIVETMARYCALMSAGDLDGVVALFAEDAVVCDPIDQPEHRGRERIRGFFARSFEGNGGAVRMELEGAVRVAGNLGAAAMIAHASSGDQRIRCETLDVMTFDSEGRIGTMDAFWGPINVTITQV